jgi:hypothetical protein
MVELRFCKPAVIGSNPIVGYKKCVSVLFAFHHYSAKTSHYTQDKIRLSVGYGGQTGAEKNRPVRLFTTDREKILMVTID